MNQDTSTTPPSPDKATRPSIDKVNLRKSPERTASQPSVPSAITYLRRPIGPGHATTLPLFNAPPSVLRPHLTPRSVTSPSSPSLTFAQSPVGQSYNPLTLHTPLGFGQMGATLAGSSMNNNNNTNVFTPTRMIHIAPDTLEPTSRSSPFGPGQNSLGCTVPFNSPIDVQKVNPAQMGLNPAMMMSRLNHTPTTHGYHAFATLVDKIEKLNTQTKTDFEPHNDRIEEEFEHVKLDAHRADPRENEK